MTGPPSFLFFVPRLGGGGAERAALLVARSLAERGCDMALVGHVPGEAAYRVPDHPRLTHVACAGSEPWHTWRPLRRTLRERGPAWLMTPFPGALALASAARRRRGGPRVIYWIQNNLLDQIHARGPKHLFRHAIVRRALADADLVLGCSQDICLQVEEQTRGARTAHWVPNPVDMAFTGAVFEHRAARRRRTGEAHVLQVGRLVAQKDQATLIDAFARLPESLGARLRILGDGPERGSLEERVAARGLTGQVDLPGWRDDLTPHLEWADLFVLSSRWEGMPVALLEAMACGIPVVSTDCPTGPREILEGGKYGRLVPVADAEALAHAMAEELATERNPRASRRRVSSYSPEGIAARLLEIVMGEAPDDA